MPHPLDIPASDSQSFALEVVSRLRTAGFEAVWAGGCVRDALLGSIPKDYDVATSARPDDVIALFGKRKTVAVGASFGVVIVLGTDKSQEQVEVATFRTDGMYSDGRRPDNVRFCSAKEDARRRDFTINGMFYDPVTREVIDYVDGQKDLERGMIRAIGNAEERFKEDKLRMLRAARFAARFSFELDKATAEAIRLHATDIRQVSVERISQELRHMLGHPARLAGLNLLIETSLFMVVLPNITDAAIHTARQTFPHLTEPTFEPSLAILFGEKLKPEADTQRSRTALVSDTCRSFRLSNEETSTICWLIDTFNRSLNPSRLALHTLKPILSDDRRDLLLDMIRASVRANLRPPEDMRFLSDYLAKTAPETLNPEPLITGNDLQDLGMKAGPEFSAILHQIRNEQLDELIDSHEEALKRVQQLR